MSAGLPDPLLVDGAGALARALESAAPGATILLPPDVIDIDASLTIRVPLALAAAAGTRPLLRFVSADARLVVGPGAGGGSVSGIDFTGTRHRHAPLVELAGVDGFTLADVGIGRCEGSAFLARDCARLRMERTFISDVGLGGGEIVDCDDVALDLTMTMIGRRARSAGLVLSASSGTVSLAARDVSGNAVTVRRPPRPETGPTAPLDLRLNAVECHRALAVVGDADDPVDALTADVFAEDMEDWAVLLSNCAGLNVRMQTRRAEPLRLDGKAGAQRCTIELASDRPDRVTVAGKSARNTVTPLAARPWPPRPDAPASAAFEPRFPARTVEDTCAVCGWQGRFRRTHEGIRETFACSRCRASLRYRAQAQALLSVVGDTRHPTLEALSDAGGLDALSIFEPGQAGPFRPYLANAAVYRASVYAPGRRSGELVDGVECQDITATSFEDKTFDLVVTSDIMEHVRRPDEAWREIHRILKPGGHHVFSIPLTAEMPPRSVSRVDTSGEEDRLLMPAVYHGDGAAGLSLVYTDFGADLLDTLASLGLPTAALPYRSSDPLCASVLSFVSQRLP
ncbi:class I SAM-dependent methyltransferase [Acuticoccus sediminis]|uniref:class I SAM-dependent methyltransferase n=1 Tax=Acuticoccus sediminis TaxID=2184697 RepID=UPI001CFD380F|nr:class I SAM-dependent methyltransferase [Acuticoccus sediminis]